MSEKEKQIAENLVKACALLPDEKKEFLLGYAEGVAAMAEKSRKANRPRTPSSKLLYLNQKGNPNGK